MLAAFKLKFSENSKRRLSSDLACLIFALGYTSITILSAHVCSEKMNNRYRINGANKPNGC